MSLSLAGVVSGLVVMALVASGLILAGARAETLKWRRDLTFAGRLLLALTCGLLLLAIGIPPGPHKGFLLPLKGLGNVLYVLGLSVTSAVGGIVSLLSAGYFIQEYDPEWRRRTGHGNLIINNPSCHYGVVGVAACLYSAYLVVQLLVSIPIAYSAARAARPVLLTHSPVDGAALAYVPAGEFQMGGPSPDGLLPYETLPHVVNLEPYYIYKTEVTVAQYRKFCNATGRKMPKAPPWGWDDAYPIVNVTWNDASAYAAWAGASLPTEAQWEKAARGTRGRVYPWGDQWAPERCVHSVPQPRPVGSLPAGASPYGCLDMAGNVSEWCADWYDVYYYQSSPSSSPTGPATGEYRAIRGNSFDWGDEESLTCWTRRRWFPDDGTKDCGFRCVVTPPEPDNAREDNE